jgi:nicotinamide-nucleotide amidase
LVTRYFQISGIGESTLSDLVIGDVGGMLGRDLELAYLPHSHGITLRLTSYAGESADLARLTDHIRTRAAAYIHSDLPDTELERSVVDAAMGKGLRLATAESCTGGWLANLITNISGSSAMFLGGVVAYDNSVKSGLLDVPESMLLAHGAVSREVALHMAKSVAQRLGADIGLSTTGIAGPTGGTDDKPVGLVWIGFWSQQAHFAVQARFFRDRVLNKERSAKVALEIARRQMLGIAGLPYDLKAEPA